MSLLFSDTGIIAQASSGGGGGNANVFVLSSWLDVPEGAEEGAFGFITGTSVPLRLKAVTLPSIGERLTWIFAQDYALTITALSVADGTESNIDLETTLGDQGSTVTTTGSSSITSDGTEIFLATTGSSSVASLITTTGLDPGTVFRFRANIRSLAPSTGDIAYMAAGDGTNQVSLYASSGVPAFQVVNSGGTALYAANNYYNGPSNLPDLASTPTRVALLDGGATVGVQIQRDGTSYVNSQRLTSGSVPVFADGCIIAASSGGAGNGQTVALRELLAYTVT